MKKFLSLFITLAISVTSFTAFATENAPEGLLIMPSPALSGATENGNDDITVLYNDEAIDFDVKPIIENERTLVPFRAIFETMGCVVGYSVYDNSKQLITAYRGNDFLSFVIGENRMLFNDEEIELDVPAKIENDRTLVPIRAITEAFDCEVLWDGETQTVSIYPPAGFFNIKAQKLEETITDDNGNALIEVVAYYPFIENETEIPFVDEINDEYKLNAENFVSEARASKDDALAVFEQSDKDSFNPFTYEMTYTQTYNSLGVLSITNHKFVYLGGAHPTTLMESRTFIPGSEEECSVSTILDEELLEDGLVDYVVKLFADKLTELGLESDSEAAFDFVLQNIGYVEFYLKDNSLVLYFNQGDIAPYALGVISVEIPYDESLFFVDMNSSMLDECVYEREYDRGYEWVIVDYSKDKLSVTEDDTVHLEEELLSEYYPVGAKKFTIKGIDKGNAHFTIAHIEKGGDISTATSVMISTIYVDENNKLTIIDESDDISLIKTEDAPASIISPLPSSIDVSSLTDCTVAVSFDKGDVYLDDDGQLIMKAMVYSYDLYDMVDIATMKVGDTFIRHNEEVTITSIERTQTGLIHINGGEGYGGFDLASDDSTVYYEQGMNDIKAYYESGEVTIPVSTEFIYTDESDLEIDATVYYPGDFLTDDAGIEYDFIPYNTSIVITDGYVTEMTRIYTP